jgi:hypothetical protein
MRKAILAAVAALAIGGATTGILIANAQPAPPPQGVDSPPPPRPHWMGWMQRGPAGAMHALAMRRNFGLVYRAEDRQLTPSDVQKIAEGFLLWNGNHSWKVIDVAPTSDGAIGFALATADGGVIARFTIDPHTARVTRTG